MNESYYLIVAIAGRDPIVYRVSGEIVTIGRKPGNDIQILVDQVSGRHAEFVRAGAGYELVDVGSSNGTRVGGQSIKNGRVALRHLDRILFGETVPAYFAVAREGESVDAPSVVAEAEGRPVESSSASSTLSKPARSPDGTESGPTMAVSKGDARPAPKKKITVQPRLGSAPISPTTRSSEGAPGRGPTRPTGPELPRLGPPPGLGGPGPKPSPVPPGQGDASSHHEAASPAPAPRVAKMVPPDQRQSGQEGQEGQEEEKKTEGAGDRDAEGGGSRRPRPHLPGREG